ncbi:hypothetical protein, partial [Escherichia coli]|uniref:hypothetical protein n=1 Tax=Escherichia coli TaxID=562 RepID=UPI003F479218
MDDTEYSKGLVRATFKLARADIDSLKNMLASWQEKRGKEKVHLSTFVVTFAYILVCLLKTTGS